MAKKQPRERKSSLWAAPGIAAQVEEIVGEVRVFLADEKFLVAWTDKRLKMFGCEVMVNATVVGGKAAALVAGLPKSQLPEPREAQFYLISINENRWKNAEADQRLFALDTAISSCGKNDKGGLCRIMPDGVFYVETVRRRGIPTTDMQRLAKVIQAALPGLEEAEASAETAAEVERSGLTTAMSADEAAELVRETTEGEPPGPSGHIQSVAYEYDGQKAEAGTPEAREILDAAVRDALTSEQAALDAEPSQLPVTDETEHLALPKRPRRRAVAEGDGLPAAA